MIDATPSLQAAETISLPALTDYLHATGWQHRPSRVEGVTIFSKDVPGFGNPILFILPARAGFSDEHQRMAGALRTLEAVEERPIANIVQDIQLLKDPVAGGRESVKGLAEEMNSPGVNEPTFAEEVEEIEIANDAAGNTIVMVERKTGERQMLNPRKLKIHNS